MENIFESIASATKPEGFVAKVNYKDLNAARKAYSEILKAIKKHKDICAFDVQNLESRASTHLFGIELKEVYGLNINPLSVNSTNWISLGDYKRIGWFGSKYGRTISWSDNGKQPDDELLFTVSFSTGAYIFGGDYPTAFFEQFFSELKSYNPKYIDSANHSLYYAISEAKEIFNNFDSIMKKYHELNREDYKKRKIEEMKKELAKLES